MVALDEQLAMAVPRPAPPHSQRKPNDLRNEKGARVTLASDKTAAYLTKDGYQPNKHQLFRRTRNPADMICSS
jgi:hypothetical protein